MATTLSEESTESTNVLNEKIDHMSLSLTFMSHFISCCVPLSWGEMEKIFLYILNNAMLKYISKARHGGACL